MKQTIRLYSSFSLFKLFRDIQPYIQSLSNNVRRILTHTSPTARHSFLQLVKDNVGLKTPTVYRIKCKCGAVYSGEMGHKTEDKTNEHGRDHQLYHPEHTAMTEYTISQDHYIHFE